MSARIDAATLLQRALTGDAAKVRVAIVIDGVQSTRWASATFVGARHRMTIEGRHDRAAVTWLGGLAEADLPLRGHLVADLAIIEQVQADDRFTAIVEVLTVEET